MSGSVNKVILVGNLCQDVEVKSFSNGGRIANLRIATNEQWKDRTTGEKKDKVEYHSVTLSSDGLVGVAERYLKKGSKVYVEGSLATRKWQDATGNDRYTTEIRVGGFDGKLVMLDGNKGGAGGGTKAADTPSDSSWDSIDSDLDDDVPFATNDVRFERRVF